jgi:hypothetical protein
MASKLDIRNSLGNLIASVLQGNSSPFINIVAEDTYSFAISTTSGTGSATLAIGINQSDEGDPKRLGDAGQHRRIVPADNSWFGGAAR